MPSYANIASQYGATVNSPSQATTPDPYQSVASKYGATVTNPTQPNALEQVSTFFGINNLSTSLPDALQQAKNYFSHPIQSGENELNAAGQAFIAPLEQEQSAHEEFTNAPTTSGKVAGAVNELTGLAGVIFSPINAAFAAAEQVPGLKEAADIMQVPFSVAGHIGNFAGEEFVNVLPISDQDKSILKPAFSQAAGLVSQILLGGKVMDMVVKETPLTKGNVDKATTEAQNEAEQAKTTMSQPPAQKPLKPQDLANKATSGFEFDRTSMAEVKKQLSSQFDPATVAEITKGIPETKAGVKVADVNNKIQLLEIQKQREGSSLTAPKTNPIAATQATPTDKYEAAAQKYGATVKSPVKGSRVSKAAADINSNIVERGFAATPPESLAQTRSLPIEEQKATLKDALNNNYQDLEDMALGKKPNTLNVRDTLLFNTVTEKAIAENDIGLQRKLAQSPLASGSSEAAGELGATAYNNGVPEGNPVRAMQDVQKTAEANLKAKGIDIAKEEAKDRATAKKAMEKTAPKEGDLDDIINSMVC